jgi:hypothetical protein
MRPSGYFVIWLPVLVGVLMMQALLVLVPPVRTRIRPGLSSLRRVAAPLSTDRTNPAMSFTSILMRCYGQAVALIEPKGGPVVRIQGYCTSCRRIRWVEVVAPAPANRLNAGICTQCKDTIPAE